MLLLLLLLLLLLIKKKRIEQEGLLAHHAPPPFQPLSPPSVQSLGDVTDVLHPRLLHPTRQALLALRRDLLLLAVPHLGQMRVLRVHNELARRAGLTRVVRELLFGGRSGQWGVWSGVLFGGRGGWDFGVAAGEGVFVVRRGHEQHV